MAVKFFNTFSGQKEEFVPLTKGQVKCYVCGPTIYDYIHIGNARAFIVFDVMRKFLQYLGYEVTYVMNLTDIDDKIINRSREEGKDFQEITATYAQAFFEDIDVLGVARADFHPKATEHIDEIIALISRLVKQGFAYEVNGDVFFDVLKFRDYGHLSGKKTDDLISGARVAVDEAKRNPLDFALWKSQKPGEPAWNSPWGKGRPGWHVECSAMSMKYLGDSFDIHAGGVDLIFPHHENEIAQSEGATRKKFVKYWLHNGFLKIDGNKMAKSLGNFRTVRDIVKTYPGPVVRLFFLQKHYRGPIDFTQDGLNAAASAVERLHIFYEKLHKTLANAKVEGTAFDPASLKNEEKKFWDFWQKAKKELIAFMEDDLNTPPAVSRLFEMVREFNKLLSQESFSTEGYKLLSLAKKDFDKINGFLGVLGSDQKEDSSELVEGLMALLIEVREELRAKREWGLADKIRDELNEAGVLLEDSKGGTLWRKK